MDKKITLELSPEQFEQLFMAVITASAIRNAQLTGKYSHWFTEPLCRPELEKQRNDCYALEGILRAYLP